VELRHRTGTESRDVGLDWAVEGIMAELTTFAGNSGPR
jgi:hypothetical protein